MVALLCLVALFALGCASYVPGLTILGRMDTPWLGWVAPLAGPVFLAASLALWRLGVRHYTSTGS